MGFARTVPKTNPNFLQGLATFAPSPYTTKGHVTSPMLIITSMTHTIKAPRDQLPPAPPATLKACIQPIVFNIVFYPTQHLVFFPTGKSRTCDTSTTGQSPVSSQPNQNKQLSTRFLNTSWSWLKILQIISFLQNWDICFQSKTNQNHHQLDQKHHTGHHRVLRPNKITLPRY